MKSHHLLKTVLRPDQLSVLEEHIKLLVLLQLKLTVYRLLTLVPLSLSACDHRTSELIKPSNQRRLQ